jgi:hypothetical protein
VRFRPPRREALVSIALAAYAALAAQATGKSARTSSHATGRPASLPTTRSVVGLRGRGREMGPWMHGLPITLDTELRPFSKECSTHVRSVAGA